MKIIYCRIFPTKDKRSIVMDIPAGQFQAAVRTCPKPSNLLGECLILPLQDFLKIKGDASLYNLYFDGELTRANLKVRDPNEPVIIEEISKKKSRKKKE